MDALFGHCWKVIRMSGKPDTDHLGQLGFCPSGGTADEACHHGLFESEYLVEPPMGIEVELQPEILSG